jgi:plastocyanin
MKRLQRVLVVSGAVATGLLFVASSGAQYGGGYGGSPSPAPKQPTAKRAANRVDVVDFAFRPKTLHAKKGSVVTWLWRGRATHNVTFTSLGKHSRTQTSGSYHLRFSKAGSFHYHCTIHGFTGTIVVR